MQSLTANLKSFLFFGIVILLTGCGGGGSGGNNNGNSPANQQALINEINNRFPYVANQPLEQLFICTISGSVLIWYLGKL